MAAEIPVPFSLQSMLDAAPVKAGQRTEAAAQAAPPFQAGKLFVGQGAREAWLSLAPSSVLQRVVVDGFSEFLRFPVGRDGRRRPVPLRSNHAVSALKESAFVSAEVAKLCQINAVSDVTHLQHDTREVCYKLGLLVAERHG